MKIENPSKLIVLLGQLLAETEKMNIGKIYIAIMSELKRIAFVETNNPFTEKVYKNLIELSIKDYIHSGRSEKSSAVIKDVIDVLETAEVTIS